MVFLCGLTRLSTNSISWAITWPKSLALKAQFKCFTHRMTLINESHHLSQLSRNCFSVQKEGNSAKQTAARVADVRNWISQLVTKTQTHTHTQQETCAHTHCVHMWRVLVNRHSLCLLINLCSPSLHPSHTHTHTDSNQPSVSFSSF